MRSIVWRLLRRNISAGQLLGYGLANLVGLAIVLTAIQFYRDVTGAWEQDDSFISRDYLIVSKRIDGVTGLLGGAGAGANEFTPAEVADIAAQPWAAKVGAFTAANFGVAASVEMNGRGMNTFLFLESIPDEFFDVSPRGWRWDGDTSQPVPIIISKDYLALYNFGFAASRGLPQISESIVGMVPLRLSLSGNGRQVWLPARIVGFSSRLNTIAVPQEFMQWANGQFAEEPQPNPSRLIVSTNSPGDPQAKAYFDAHGVEIAGDRLDTGRAAYFLSLITTIVIAIGAVISLLSFFILLLSIYLLLQKNREKIHQLMQLGYAPRAVAGYYYRIVAAVNACVLAASVGILLLAQHAWAAQLDAVGARGSSAWVSILVGCAAMAAITALNFAAISRKVRGAFRE